ncbi:NUDIX hydrolase [Cellulomonas sp. NS3]|uniref:NUDIX hydrolase n=1 Tax=Cellulomonas sp. NS3 TaxID=2973977 RepID=UPI0021622A50|nr:NUDIX hydrolase [Cellulomonas sp. NS3]
MRWQTFGERTVYDSPWVRVALVDVEVPGVGRLDHHVVRMPAHAAGTVVHDPERGVLMLWRHRFITDSWGWEIPAGRLEDGETPADAGARETLEETGWRPGPLRPLVQYHPTNGSSDQTFHVFVADGATHIGEPADAFESERVAWVPLDEVRALVRDGGIGDGLSLTGLLRFLLDRP